MSFARDEQERLLRECGATLARTQKHEIWKLPSGFTFTRSSTSSDHRADKNSLALLRSLLNLNGERGQPGERRARRDRRAQEPVIETSLEASSQVALSDLKESLLSICIEKSGMFSANNGGKKRGKNRDKMNRALSPERKKVHPHAPGTEGINVDQVLRLGEKWRTGSVR